MGQVEGHGVRGMEPVWVVGDPLGPHAVVRAYEGRWRLSLVDCHRELVVSFLHLSEALEIAEKLVETAVMTAAMAYDAAPLVWEASA